MGILEKIFLLVLQGSLTASIAILIILLILKVFKNNIGVRVKNVLWILVLIKLIIPVIPQMDISLFSILYQKYENILELQDQKNNLHEEKELYTFSKEKNDIAASYNQNIEMNQKDKIEKIDKQNLILFIFKIASCMWGIGLLILISAFLLCIFKFKRKIKYFKSHMYPEIQVLMDECKDKVNVKSNIPICIYDDFKSPCILGVIKPKIYIPEYVIHTNNHKQISHIFLHELMHYKRKDLFYNFLGIIALSIHWFNPIVWFAINKMKLYREYACDACVLEILGEKENIDYGMTLINFTKMFSNKNKYSQLAIFFETNNQIKRRIEMIKEFKKGSYKISTKAVLGCVIATSILFTNSVMVKGIDINNIATTTSNNIVNTKDKHEFLIDAPLKVYDDIEKVEKIVGFKFKVPDYNEVNSGFQIAKISDENNAIQKYFKSSDNDGERFLFQAFEKDPIESLKKIVTVREESTKVEAEQQTMNVDGINGLSVTLTKTNTFKVPDEEIKDLQVQVEVVDKYFVWKNEGLWYSINYNSISKCDGENSKESMNLSEDTIGKIAKSIKYPEEIKNVDYSANRKVSTKNKEIEIYDKEDLENAKKLLGFNPKLPLKINEDIKIHEAYVRISGDSDIKNNNINYEINNIYSNKSSSITFKEQKNSKIYDDIKNNGYFNQENTEDNIPKQIKAQKLNINNNEVFKYQEKEQGKDPKSSYLWKEDSIYCSVTFLGETENSDEIIKEFVNSKPID